MTPNFIIPYRDRADHLKKFLPALASYMDITPYRVLVIEQENSLPFNRGMLINIGFDLMVEGYMVSHDVDMIPVSVDYSFSPVAHLAGKCSQFNYKMPYPQYFGGVNVFSKEVFRDINGFSNNYWGWGAEDDDLLKRVKSRGHNVISRAGKFECFNHARDMSNHGNNLKQLNACSQILQFRDGLNSLKYEVIEVREEGNVKIYKINFE